MLENWILEIREETDTYQSHFWRYQISGNSIELSVLRPFLKDKEAYRSAIIAIGRVLKALSYKIENSSSHFLIQSFPSIENPEVIASIRINEGAYDGTGIKPSLDTADYDSFEEELLKFAEFYQLKLEQPDSDLMESCGIDPEKFKKRNWKLVTSKFDNPFTWLNVGFWQESITRSCAKKSGKEPHFIMKFCRKNEENKNAKAALDEDCPQILIAYG
ncbi:MAG: hypothetical protein JJU37_01495 [Balneolaceae bacterium]|nr:hypothetical protein [Balneolaceae bacterium]